MIPQPLIVNWTRLQAARRQVRVKLPDGRYGVRIRRVILGGQMLALADDTFFEPPTPATIPVGDQEAPLGVYVVEYDARGFFTDRILHLQDRFRPTPNRGET